MTLAEILYDIKSGKEYEVITSWKEIPIRLKLKVRWVPPQERYISFDFKECKFKQVFSEKDPVYIKIGELFLLCKVFSNIRDELVLEVDSPVPAPPIVLREFIRVQPTEREPVYVSFCLGDDCVLKVEAVDISESGVGVLLHKEEANRIMENLMQIVSDVQRMHTVFDIEVELPKEGVVKAQGELKNIIGRQEDVYIRLGFKINLEESQKIKIRQYIMRRQREILDQLKKAMKSILKISIRFLLSGKGSTQLVSFIALLGVSLGVSALLLTMGVFAGFQHELKEKILSASPHIIVSLLDTNKDYKDKIENIEGRFWSNHIKGYTMGFRQHRKSISAYLVSHIVIFCYSICTYNNIIHKPFFHKKACGRIGYYLMWYTFL